MGFMEVARLGLVAKNTTSTPADPMPTRSRLLLPAVVACAPLWIVTAFAAQLGLEGAPAIALATCGVVLTGVILVIAGRQHARLRDLARTDTLTGLANHRGFHEALGNELVRAAELEHPLALVVVDLDDFKQINDTHGHPYGDRVLGEVGAALRRAVRLVDTPARVGGEEFALVLPGSDAATAFVVAERAREEIASLSVDGTPLSCSAGIAAFPNDAEDAATLCQYADSALYWAKRGGKRRTRRFDPDHSPAAWNSRQRDEVVDLLGREGAITPTFQPVVSLATGRVVGYEALARFDRAGRRSPDVWFAQAHGCGLGAELEAMAVRAALAADGRLLGAHLAINLSPSALSSDVVARVLQGSLDGLIIEITEHEFVPDDESLGSAIADLRERGARIAIDDAGAGHAGLKQLMRVQPDIVKLDRALIREIHVDRARIALVESFVRFAREVGAIVCAEGIETLEELAVLADLDVQWGQGYALGRPSPPWVDVAPDAAALCRETLAETFRSLPTEHGSAGSSDRRLVHVTARLAEARTRGDLEAALALITEELDADAICLSAWHPEPNLLETLAESGETDSADAYDVSRFPLSARVLTEQEAVQVVADDPGSDPREVELLLAMGHRSLLIVPVVCRGEALGMIEAYRVNERPWSRGEINRARVIANQFASVVPALRAREPGAIRGAW